MESSVVSFQCAVLHRIGVGDKGDEIIVKVKLWKARPSAILWTNPAMVRI